MRVKDRRALLILALWGAGAGLWLLGRTWRAGRSELKGRREAFGMLKAKEATARENLAQSRAQRKALLASTRPAWMGMGENRLRLESQGILLAAAQQAGIQDPNLVSLPVVGGIPGWRLEGTGSLEQWMGFVEAVSDQAIPLQLQALHWGLNGDPWTAPSGGNGKGPSLRGATEWTGPLPRTDQEAP